jgi:hypothetical protein
MWVAFTRQDGLHDRYPGRAGDIADHVVELQVHLIQSLLHVLHVTRRHLHQAVAVTEDRSHRTDRLLGPERPAQ